MRRIYSDNAKLDNLLSVLFVVCIFFDSNMEKPVEHNQLAEQNRSQVLSDLYEEFQGVKAQNSAFERRLARIESAIEGLTRNIRRLIPTEPFVEEDLTTVDKFITDYIQSHSSANEEHEVDIEGVKSNWNYFVAQKGGYDEVLYMTMQDLLNLGEDSVQFLIFLAEKRHQEVVESVKQLQEEFQKQEGNQLQQHFKNLWELHHNLLKKKMVRTWKEEVFLNAFNTFISWLQQ